MSTEKQPTRYPPGVSGNPTTRVDGWLRVKRLREFERRHYWTPTLELYWLGLPVDPNPTLGSMRMLGMSFIPGKGLSHDEV